MRGRRLELLHEPGGLETRTPPARCGHREGSRMAGALWSPGSRHVGGDNCSVIALLLRWFSQKLRGIESKKAISQKRYRITYFTLCSYMQIRKEFLYNYVENRG